MFSLSLVLFALVSAVFGHSCPPEGQYFYPHPKKCSKFIECNDGVTAIIDCFNDLIFNAKVGYCDFPSNYPCEDKPEEGPVGQCPEVNGEFVEFLTDFVRCDIFYMCDWGNPIRSECPPGLHFNPTLWVCDYPQDAGCIAGN